jgi:hypothetical protein
MWWFPWILKLMAAVGLAAQRPMRRGNVGLQEFIKRLGTLRGREIFSIRILRPLKFLSDPFLPW